jgi:hypothetical protein
MLDIDKAIPLGQGPFQLRLIHCKFNGGGCGY